MHAARSPECVDPSFSFIITYKFRKAMIRVKETRNGLTRGERVFSRGEGGVERRRRHTIEARKGNSGWKRSEKQRWGSPEDQPLNHENSIRKLLCMLV